MHRADAEAHQEATCEQVSDTDPAAARHPERPPGRCDRDEHRRDGQRQVVGHRGLSHAEGQHAGEMHGPDAQPQGEGAAGQPEFAGESLGQGDPAGHVERRVTCADGNHHREHDQNRVVVADRSGVTDGSHEAVRFLAPVSGDSGPIISCISLDATALKACTGRMAAITSRSLRQDSFV
ncbi:hypothetical protein D3C87_1460240 [compost metagenome]